MTALTRCLGQFSAVRGGVGPAISTAAARRIAHPALIQGQTDPVAPRDQSDLRSS